MSRENHFMQLCPSLTKTFSFRRVPCSFEQASQSAALQSNVGKQNCPDLQYCLRSSGALWRFELVYGPWLRVSMSEPSSSIVVRSEHHFNKNERRRLALRKHLYELSADHGNANLRIRRTPAKLGLEFVESLLRLVPGKLVQQVHDLFHNGFKDVGEFEAVVTKLQLSSPDLQYVPYLRTVWLVHSLAGREFRSSEELSNVLRGLLRPEDYRAYGKRIVSRAFSPLDCYVLQDGDRFGHYVGFVDLRPNSFNSPLAIGVLALPRRYRHSRDSFVITGNYGELFGGPGFPSTIYSMHDSTSGGAHCAQACVIMALGILTDRGAHLSGSYTLTYLAKMREATKIQPGTRSGSTECLGNVPHESAGRFTFDAGYSKGGIKPKALAKLLQDNNVNACLFREESNPQSAKLAQRLIEANVSARFPVILAVDSNAWWPWTKTKQLGHAVLVVGFRRLPGASGEIALITHDPGFIPYFERPFSDCQKACALYSGNGRICMIFVTRQSVSCHAYQCVLSLMNDESEDKSLFQEYLESDNDVGTDYRIGLVVRDDLAETVYSRNPLPDRKYVVTLQHAIEERLPRSRYWCIAGTKNRKLKWIWMFDSKDDPNPGLAEWKMRLAFEGQDVELCWRDQKNVRRSGHL